VSAPLSVSDEELPRREEAADEPGVEQQTEAGADESASSMLPSLRFVGLEVQIASVMGAFGSASVEIGASGRGVFGSAASLLVLLLDALDALSDALELDRPRLLLLLLLLPRSDSISSLVSRRGRGSSCALRGGGAISSQSSDEDSALKLGSVMVKKE
jgi:hypothetical protein